MPDLALLRDDLSAFAEAAGAPLTPWQSGSLQLETRTTVIVAPRQSGKSRSLAVLALHWAFRRREQRVLIVSAGEDASRRLLAEVRRIASGSPWLAPSVVDETAGLLTLSNRSEVRSVPASERAIRGWATDLLLIDEAALVPDDLLLGAALPTTAARPDARIVLASSATVANGSFYDHALTGERGGSPHIRTYRWALSDATWIAPSAVEAMRQSMSPLRFSAEMLGEFAGAADLLLSSALHDRQSLHFAHVGLDGLRGPARFALGTDWGWSSDRTAVSVVGRLHCDGPPVFGVVSSKAWPSGFENNRAIAEIAASPAAFCRAVSETNDLGAPLTRDLFSALRRRPAESGGARPQPRFVVIEEGFDDGSIRWRRPRREGREGFSTQLLGVSMTAPSRPRCSVRCAACWSAAPW